MNGSDTLAILAEVFVAFAGFTGIVAVLGQRSEGQWRPVDILRFQGLLGSSLAGLVFSVIPFGFHFFDVSPAITWGVLSGLLAGFIALTLLLMILKQQQIKATDDPDFVPGVRAVLMAISVPVLILLALNASGTVLEREFAGYLFGLLYLLVMCCAMFVLLLRFIRTDEQRIRKG